ncbi:MAG: hypothetical protein KBT50_00810, partial [Cycloclasticus sp.]|nr:hypothetical protein [Cycloclasticus sp.]
MNKYMTSAIFVAAVLMSNIVWAENTLRMSTTTSTENSGLLAVLNPVFEAKYQVKLGVIAVGTG